MAQERRVFLSSTTNPATSSPAAGTHNSEAEVGAVVTLDEVESHHLLQVLRLAVGAPVVAIDPHSRKLFRSSIVSNQGFVILKLEEELPGLQPHNRNDTLVAPLLKGDHIEFIIEKATELGIHAIKLYQAERSVVKIKAEDAAVKCARWERIGLSAAKQCRRESLPIISLAQSLEAALEGAIGGFYASLQSSALEIAKAPPPKSATHLVTGPEGDFSPAEELLLANRGFIPVSLGALVLRAETAAMVMATTALTLWGERDWDEVP